MHLKLHVNILDRSMAQKQWLNLDVKNTALLVKITVSEKRVDLLNLHIADLMGRHDRLLNAHRKLVLQMHRARESLSMALPYL